MTITGEVIQVAQAVPAALSSPAPHRGEDAAAHDPLAYSELNASLHALIQEIAGQVTARTILARLQGRLVRHQFRLSLQPGRSTVSLGQHEKIVDAIVAGKPAEAAMRDHLRDVISQISQSRTPRTVPATS